MNNPRPTHVVQLRNPTTDSIRWYDSIWFGTLEECEARRARISNGNPRLDAYSRVRALTRKERAND